jgi:sulfoxide reductase heme-binding subunit YedZ
MGGHLFWITSRAAGIVALLASSGAVTLGLLQGSAWLKGRAAELRAGHEALSLATLVALAVHGLVLVGDGFLRPSVLDVTLPLTWGYMRVWTTLGIVAGWALVLLGLSYYARGRIGPARWKRLHRWTALAWILGIAHSIGEGTDANTGWFLAATLLTAAPALALLVVRLGGRAAATTTVAAPARPVAPRREQGSLWR